MTTFSTSSKERLTERDLARFPGDTLFDRIARTVCRAGCLPRKELYEAWEVARRTRRLFRGGRLVDLGAGHGLLAQILMILDDTSAAAIAIDTRLPDSAAKLHSALVGSWPRLQGRITFEERSLDAIDLHCDDVVVSSHACGALTDVVLNRAVAAHARVAVLPCCHHIAEARVGGARVGGARVGGGRVGGGRVGGGRVGGGNPSGLPLAGALSGWVDGPLAIDIMRAVRLEQQGYRVWTQTIPANVTPKNRLLLAAPLAPVSAGQVLAPARPLAGKDSDVGEMVREVSRDAVAN